MLLFDVINIFLRSLLILNQHHIIKRLTLSREFGKKVNFFKHILPRLVMNVFVMALAQACARTQSKTLPVSL